MNKLLCEKVDEIDNANGGIEIALSGIQLALDDIESSKKFLKNPEFLSNSIDVLYLSMQRIYEEHNKLTAIIKEMFSAAKQEGKNDE